jgi:alanine dehydrogenase
VRGASGEIPSQGRPEFLDAAAVEAALPYPDLIEALRRAFIDGIEAPVRHHHAIPVPDGSANTLLLMPAWQPGSVTGVKLVHVCPDNPARGLPSVPGLYILCDGPTGMPLAVMDGAALTLRRTAAASALAASHLARADTERMLMVGAGALAPHLVRAHATVRPIARVAVWNRDAARSAALVARLRDEGIEARVALDLEAAVPEAELVSCATMSSVPLVRGAWLAPGTHLDLVGAYRPDMRESDDEVMRRGRVFVDTMGGALSEAGDILQAIGSGALAAGQIVADLALLCRGLVPGRASPEEITVFKSCGTALEDLAAAELVVRGRARG